MISRASLRRSLVPRWNATSGRVLEANVAKRRPEVAVHLRRASQVVALFATFTALPARAHDPFESWVSAILRPERFELTITMAQATALKLIDPKVTIAALSVENFSQHRARLEQEGAVLCILTANRARLAPAKVEVDLTEENDVLFKITYSRPPAGRLHFHAAFLKKLGEGYGGILEASDSAGNHLGWEQVSWEYPNFEVTIPASEKPKSSAVLQPPPNGVRVVAVEVTRPREHRSGSRYLDRYTQTWQANRAN